MAKTTVTAFGRLVRIWRMEKGFMLKDMADALQVTSSYMSALETGKKRISDDIIEQVCAYLELEGPSKQDLIDAAAVSQPSISIDLNGLEERDRMLGVAFARRIGSLSQEKREEMLKLLGED
ncbi:MULTISPECIES: helix-turn-helix domain-containing protein [Citrobacter]|uniref:helix-turn-helix domain-containing protein n=1 Tax=Citrobacter TaxID=544 RepID=UPI001981B61C|nr:helix-turn-helix transcriptional regulator [Citrobacter sedlakii]EJK9576511.1 helix-turn-helix transcriptional regulator [Salmonella enterica]EJY1146668.1 helix-turn-helix transcriptional regulator [Salmonella enterica]MBJ8674270.1 helix-turn-helix transcriptional regulator [Citrobacter freundii]MBN6599896.1 helix-turn-helix transcriptional regulator [Citrobacter sedlakii]